MSVTVLVPIPLRSLTDGKDTVLVNATTVEGMITELEGHYPGMKDRLLDDLGVVRRFIVIYVNEEDIRFLQNQQTVLNGGDEVSIIPAIAGG
jgi:molybdopterin synthase sulfur carrier subunit